MKKLITEIVEKAMHVYFDPNQDESSKRKFYSTHFKSILFEYKKANLKFYDGVSFNAVLRRRLLNIGIFKEKIMGIHFMVSEESKHRNDKTSLSCRYGCTSFET